MLSSCSPPFRSLPCFLPPTPRGPLAVVISVCRGSSPWLRRGHGCDQCPLAVLSATFLLGICLAILPGNHKGNHEGNHAGSTWEHTGTNTGGLFLWGDVGSSHCLVRVQSFCHGVSLFIWVLTSLCGTWEPCPCRTGLLSRSSLCFQPLAGGSYHRSWFQLISSPDTATSPVKKGLLLRSATLM